MDKQKTIVSILIAGLSLGLLTGLAIYSGLNQSPDYEVTNPENNTCGPTKINISNISKYYDNESKVCLDPSVSQDFKNQSP